MADVAGLAVRRAPAGLVLAALLIVYVVWGSTYLAIRVTVREMPPLVGMGSRYVVAAVLLGAVLATRGGLRRLGVTRRELLGCAFLGLMLPVLGNGVVAVAEHRGAPSGVAALLVAVTPLMIIVFRSLARDVPRPLTLLGVLLGLAGVGYLILAGRGEPDAVPVGATLLVALAATCWAFGSWMQAFLTLPADAFVMTVHEMWIGGAILVSSGLLLGERMDPFSLSGETWVAWVYLVIFGSAVAFTAYVWLLANAPISLVSTYAYVNPVVAVILGALILDEPITHAVLIGGGAIVVAVAVVISVERKPAPDPGWEEETGAPPPPGLSGSGAGAG